ASCTTRGSGSPSWLIRKRDFGVFHRRTSEVTISDAASPAPNFRHRMRNGRSVTPAMGASTVEAAREYVPMRIMLPSESARECVIRAGDHAPWGGQAGIDLESDCVRA